MLDEIAAVLNDPATSQWLRRSLDASLERDPIDAAYDAELLKRLLDRRADIALMDSMAMIVEVEDQ